MTAQFTHNARDRRTARIKGDGTIVTYLYNSRGELAEVIDSSSLLPAPGSRRPLATYGTGVRQKATKGSAFRDQYGFRQLR